MSNGATILICTHNGARRLPETLRHVAAQQVPAGLAWEVLLVSNASQDDTLTLAPREWARLGAPAPLRMLDEPRPGKEHALTRGFDAAHYEYVCIVDDDNWLSPSYLAQAVALMQAHPEIGILGAHAEAASEGELPGWFAAVQGAYAVGPQAARPGPLRAPGAYVYGAGSVVRRAGWQHLRAQGFAFTTSTQRGARLVSGEDVELGDVLRLAGYELWYEPRLRLRHFMSPERLRVDYLRRIGAGTAASSLPHTVAYLLLREPALEAAGFSSRYYRWLGWAARELLRPPGRLLAYYHYGFDSSQPDLPGAFAILQLLGRLRDGWRQRHEAVLIFQHLKALQRRLQAHPAPIHSLPPSP